MSASVRTGTLSGVDAHAVLVEVSGIRGLPGLDIVGLPEAAIRESRARVTAALRNSGFSLPEQRFVVNLAPADLRKSGASFDLALAIALLTHCGLCAPNRLDHTLIVGELALDGTLRSVRGVLAQLRSARARGLERAIVPEPDAPWAALVPDLQVHCAAHLTDVVAFLEGNRTLPGPIAEPAPPSRHGAPDLFQVRGQETAKRALEVAAAGGHNLLMVGPPGTGKTMLASRLPGLLPPPSPEEALDIATIASAGGLRPPDGVHTMRPFRAPHHSASEVALVGGGDPIRPGEVTLAHGGVLFLDELPEFRRAALEALRPTMESGVAAIARARERLSMPARPIVVAAMNPCPCGYRGDKRRVCRCSPEQVQRYQARVSGPMLDRFDMHVALAPLPVAALESGATGESSEHVRARVMQVREIARARREARRIQASRRTDLERLTSDLAPGALRLLHRSMEQLRLSLRAYAKILRVARTIADLERVERVETAHVAEAVQYRLLDRQANEFTGPMHVPAEPRGQSTPVPAETSNGP
jgi:magnesium chelatase family protein